MKIWIQNRNMITEQPRCIWITSDGAVESNSRRAPVLGTYRMKQGRARYWKKFFNFSVMGNVTISCHRSKTLKVRSGNLLWGRI